MNFIETLKAFQTLGCTDQAKCALACRVYLDLSEDTRITDLEKIYDSHLDLLYLRAKREGVAVNFVPILSCQQLNLQDVDDIQTKLASSDGDALKSINLAISDTTSTILYYQITGGVLEHKN